MWAENCAHLCVCLVYIRLGAKLFQGSRCSSLAFFLFVVLMLIEELMIALALEVMITQNYGLLYILEACYFYLCTKQFLCYQSFYFLMVVNHINNLVKMQADACANYPYCWKLHADMVDLLTVQILDGDKCFGYSLSFHLSCRGVHPISSFAKAMEGKGTLKYTCFFIFLTLFRECMTSMSIFK